MLPNDRKPVPPVPDRFVIGRDTFLDFGPPFHYVELLLINPGGDGTSIERVILTAGYKCTLPSKIEVAKTTVTQSVADLLGATNPCAIPEKDLNDELKRQNTISFSAVPIFRCRSTVAQRPGSSDQTSSIETCSIPIRVRQNTRRGQWGFSPSLITRSGLA